jgi:hypothetical protein
MSAMRVPGEQPDPHSTQSRQRFALERSERLAHLDRPGECDERAAFDCCSIARACAQSQHSWWTQRPFAFSRGRRACRELRFQKPSSPRMPARWLGCGTARERMFWQIPCNWRVPPPPSCVSSSREGRTDLRRGTGRHRLSQPCRQRRPRDFRVGRHYLWCDRRSMRARGSPSASGGLGCAPTRQGWRRACASYGLLGFLGA